MAGKSKGHPMDGSRSQEPHGLCGAKTRGGGTCKNPAGKGTDHPGEGRCRNHGGATPIKHGRYSKITRPRIAELLKDFEADPDPLNLLPEVLLLRSLIVDYVERYDQFTEALITWHESFHQGPGAPKPHQIVDILSVGKFITAIGQIVERIEKSKKEGSISLETLDRVMEQLGVELVAAAQETVTDEAQRAALLQAVERRWGSIQIQPDRPGSKGA